MSSLQNNQEDYIYIQQQIEKISQQEIMLEELFTYEFLQKYTKTSSISEFLAKGGYIVNSQHDFDSIDAESLDNYIKENTEFRSWSKMVGTATIEYIQAIMMLG